MSITYLEAIREAQARALAEDPRVFIYGQDVGAFGGAFKATKNLAQQFPGRVIDAPSVDEVEIEPLSQHRRRQQPDVGQQTVFVEVDRYRCQVSGRVRRRSVLLAQRLYA